MRNMIDSGVEWLGDIPETWDLVQLGSLFSEHKHKNTGMQSENLLSLSYGNIIRKDINTSDGLLPESFEGYNVIEEGDIVLRLTDLQNDQRSLRVGLSHERGIVTSAYVTLRRRNSAINSRFYYYLIHSYDVRKGFYGMGAGVRQGLNYAGVKRIMLTLPPVDEQENIVSVLDDKTAKVEALIANVQAQIEKLKGYKQSLITEKITMGLIGSVPTKESWVENQSYVPAHWNYVRGRYVAPVNKSVAMPDEDEYITYAPMECVRNDSFNPRAIQVKNLSSGLSSFAEGDVLLAKITPCFENGNVAIANNLINGVGAGSSELIAFTPIGINARFFMYYLQNTYFVESGKATIRGIGGLRRITSDFVENIALYIPDEIEQQEIVDFLDEKCSKIEALISIKQKKIEKLEQYKKSLIYEYVTGKKEVS